MNWETFYLVCFGIGLALSVLSFVGGFGHLHIGHLHIGHTHAAHTHGGGISPFNAFTIMAFLCWFGGAGYLLTHHHTFIVPIVLLLAILSGVAAAAAIFTFLTKVLLPREHVLLPEDTEMRGVVARVSSTLHANGTGEIIFSLDGLGLLGYDALIRRVVFENPLAFFGQSSRFVFTPRESAETTASA